VVVERAHSGENEKEWWYRATNKNYLQIFTPWKSTLQSVTGNIYRETKELVNYDKGGYRMDPDLRAIQATTQFIEDFSTDQMVQFGKQVFGMWFDVKASERKQLAMKYRHDIGADIRDGMPYQFVFDKQAGVGGGLSLLITAPKGYRWKEVRDEIFAYKTERIPARLVFDLTLQEMQ